MPASVVARQAAARPAHRAPLTVSVANNKGGVGKTTTAMVLGRHLARDLRVELVDLDETRLPARGGRPNLEAGRLHPWPAPVAAAQDTVRQPQPEAP